MSALGQKQTWRIETAMSALPPKADIGERDHHVRFVPEADIRLPYSMTSAAAASSVVGMVNPSALAALRLMVSSNLVGS